MFSMTWAVAVGCAFTIFWGLEGIHIGPTKFCTSIITHQFIQVTLWAEFFNDTLVFVVLMWKLGSSQQGGGTTRGDWKSRFSFRRPGMKRLTDAFLRDTQLYYLIVIVLNVSTVITFFVLDDPPTSSFRVFMVVPSTVIVNIMACRVFRNLKLGYSGFLSPNRVGGYSENGSRSGADNGYYVGALPSLGGTAATGYTSKPTQPRSEEGEEKLEVIVTERKHVQVDGLYPLRPVY